MRKKILYAALLFTLVSYPVYAAPDVPSGYSESSSENDTTAESSENAETTAKTEEPKTDEEGNTITETTETTENTEEPATDEQGNPVTEDTTATEEPTEEPATELPEDAHGEIYNAAKDIYLIQGTTSVDRVIQAIDKLDEKSHEDTIRKTRLMFNSLTMAQKARVTNEHHLFEIETKLGITYDYNSIYTEDNPYVIADGSVKDTAYVYSLSETHPSTSVSLQFTVDADMDGAKETPAISIKRPDGTQVSIAKDTAEIRDAYSNIMMTWQDKFMQMDIASGEYGSWTIITDLPVIFTEKEYAGSKQELPAIPEDNISTEATTASQKQQKEEEDQAAQTKSTLIKLGFLIVASVAFFIFWGKKGKKVNEEQLRSGKKHVDTEDLDTIIKSSEEIDRVKETLNQQLSMENFDDDYDSEPPQDTPKKEELPGENEMLTNDEDDFLDWFG